MNEIVSRVIVYLLDRYLQETGYDIFELTEDEVTKVFETVVPIAQKAGTVAQNLSIAAMEKQIQR